MGKDCLQIFLNLNIPDKDKKNVRTCIAALENYFKPKRNVVYERFVFNSRLQNPGESFDNYVTRLRKCASSCEFGLLTDELIRDRLVIGLLDRSTKGKLLGEKSLTLDKAIDIVRSHEITAKQLESMKADGQPPKEEINIIDKRKVKAKNVRKLVKSVEIKGRKREEASKKKQSIGYVKCKFCGKQQRHNKRSDCPAYNQQCGYSKKWHHFASVCMAKKRG